MYAVPFLQYFFNYNHHHHSTILQMLSSASRLETCSSLTTSHLSHTLDIQGAYLIFINTCDEEYPSVSGVFVDSSKYNNVFDHTFTNTFLA